MISRERRDHISFVSSPVEGEMSTCDAFLEESAGKGEYGVSSLSSFVESPAKAKTSTSIWVMTTW
ncbi:hypothetical protein KCP76_21985 [Salmonella enterica subsp. enterica serovar Weltevreden]|nr:hypothetical protein KCP76_21985 [Salmonella enterica subsp. enterica serovar Weltevreden]